MSSIRTREYKEIMNSHFGQESPNEQKRYASYRLFFPPVTLETSLEYGEKRKLTLPTRIEALFEEGWQPHPVIFSYQDPIQGQKTIVFTMAGGLYIIKEEDHLLMKYARKHGILEGRTQGLKTFNV